LTVTNADPICPKLSQSGSVPSSIGYMRRIAIQSTALD